MKNIATWNLRSISWKVSLWLLAISAVVMVASYTDPAVRLLYLVTLLWLGFTGIVYCWKPFVTHPWLRYAVTAIVLLLAGWFIFGGRPVNREHLRQAYLARLRSFTGAHYLWGGEGHVAIDCSGLARTALWEAMLTTGIAEHNPRLLGPQCWSFWWHDVGSHALEDGTHGYTRVIGHAIRLGGYHNAELRPGDVAIASHVHVLIYLGDDRWIEANPEDGKVVINPATENSTRGYFNVPVTLVRWRMLE